jgi:hypothetical protein
MPFLKIREGISKLKHSQLTLILLSAFVAILTSLQADEIEVNKKVVLQENDELRPLKPYINECCRNVEIDLVPSSNRKSGHLNTYFQKKNDQVPKEGNQLKEGAVLSGYDVIEKSPLSKIRANHNELKFTENIPTYSQSQLISTDKEPKVIEMVPKGNIVFIRNLKKDEIVKIPTTQRINGEVKFGNPLITEVPREEKPLKEGSVDKGYNQIYATSDLGRMLAFTDKPYNDVPRDNAMSNREKVLVPVGTVPAMGFGFLDCR